MTHTSGGFLVLLLVIAIIFMPNGCSPEKSYITESPPIVCGDSVSQQEINGESESDTSSFATALIIIIIVIFIIYCFTSANNQ